MTKSQWFKLSCRSRCLAFATERSMASRSSPMIPLTVFRYDGTNSSVTRVGLALELGAPLQATFYLHRTCALTGNV